MSVLARSILKRGISRPAARVFSRGYAEAATSDKLRLSLALPRETLYENTDVTQVNLPTTAGDIGVLANHVPIIQELRAGVVEIIGADATKQFFVSGGFATVAEDNTLSVNVAEAYPVEDFSAANVKNLLAEAQKNASSADEAVANEGKIEVEILEALAAVAK